MFKKPKVNPVYAIEQELVKERIVVGKFLESGELETTEKYMFDVLNVIYLRVQKDMKKGRMKWYFFWSLLSFLIGGIVGVLVLLQFIKR